MMSIHKIKIAAISSVIGLAGIVGTAQAGGYMGMDLVQLDSELGGWTGIFAGEPTYTYTTTHLRIRGGIDTTNWLAVEAHIVSSADDSSPDAIGGKMNHDTGVILGIFAKPHVSIGRVDLYGLLGFATADAEYDCSPTCPPKWKATLSGMAYGLGAQINMSKNFGISLDYMSYHDGRETYNDGFFPTTVDQTTSGLGAGINIKF
jgi:opacity protein-like surface antigen